MEVMENSHCPISHMDQRYAAENTKPHHTWDRHYLLALQWNVLLEWVNYFTSLVNGNYSVSFGIQLYCGKLDLLKHTMLGVEHTPLKEGEGEGPGLSS